MALLLGVGFLAGVLTAISPCVLPVLPILLAGGTAGGRRRPYAIVLGIVASFTVFTLAAASILSALHLRQDRLNQIALVLLLVLAVTLVFPRVATWLERPFYFLTRRRAGETGSGFVLGASLGLVFVPCAGPVLAAVSSIAGRERVGTNAVFVTFAYAVGAARAAAPELASAHGLPDYGKAPDCTRISAWLNTKPLTLEALRGNVVLVDFWTYSCINCIRTLPHLEAWDKAYRKDGLVIVGVHTPEFAFEHSLSNVRKAARRLGVRYPVALDNDYATWNAYSNQYWPAEYLVDRRGHVRHYHFGEGEYDRTERLIRTLLAMPGRSLPTAAAIADRTPMALTTPESYLGYQRLDRYAGGEIAHDRFATYRFPGTLPLDHLAYDGSWRVRDEEILAGRAARLPLRFHAHDVYL